MGVLDRLPGTREFTMHHPPTSEPVAGRQRYEPVRSAFVLQHRAYDHPDFPGAMALLSGDRHHYGSSALTSTTPDGRWSTRTKTSPGVRPRGLAALTL